MIPPDRRSVQLLRTKWYALISRDAHRPVAMRLVCPEWADFETFAADVGIAPSRSSVLCRIDDSIAYQKGNVYWGDQLQRSRQCRHHKLYSYGGETLNITQWAAKRGITRPSMAELLRKYPPEIALRPARKRSRRVPLSRPRTIKGVFDREATSTTDDIYSVTWCVDLLADAWPHTQEAFKRIEAIHGTEYAEVIAKHVTKKSRQARWVPGPGVPCITPTAQMEVY